MRNDYDTPWKLIIVNFFEYFIEFCFPEVFLAIDWSRTYECLDKELLKIQRNANIAGKEADALIKVWLKGGDEREAKEVWVLVHMEIQATPQDIFEKRMFEYYYKLYDCYSAPLMSVAILTDNNMEWRPSCYQHRLWGCDLTLKFPVVKLKDYAVQGEALLEHPNPIATIFFMHLQALATRGNPKLHSAEKQRLAKRLYALGYDKAEVKLLYTFLDYEFALPKEFEIEYTKEIKQFEEENNMPYIISAERLGMEKGLAQGRGEGLQEGLAEGQRAGELAVLKTLLERKFGPLSIASEKSLAVMDSEQLKHVAIQLLDGASLDEMLSNPGNSQRDEH